MDKQILLSDKRSIYDKIIGVSFEPGNFEWSSAASQNSENTVVSCLRYKNSDYFFLFDFFKEYYYCTYSPGSSKRIEKPLMTKDWPEVIRTINLWLYNLKKEIDTIDPWDKIDKYIPETEINLEDESSNAPFAYQQVKHIGEAVDRLKQEIAKNYKLDAAQSVNINSKLDYLVDRSQKLGRIDWKNIFVATIINVAIILALNPQQARSLWLLVKNCFKGILLLN